MFLPDPYGYDPDISTTASGHGHGHGSKDRVGGWSSIIGVVTAICGNVLISFALNTQRYAHLRLSRDRQARQQEKRRAGGQQKPHAGSYGTNQADAARQRAADSAKAEANGTLQEPEEATETEPLIPRRKSRDTSTGNGDTSHDEEADEEAHKEKSYLRSPIWWVGIVLMVIGETGNFLAYGFAPASIVSPLGVVALISNCIIAPLFLGEHFRWRDALGVIIAIAGCVVVVLSASSSNPKLTPGAIWRLVTTWEFETYLGITLFLIVVLMAMSNKFGHKSILIDIGLVGLFGGYTALSTKGVASLLTYKIWRVITFPITYLLVAVLVVTAVMQIKYINRALQRFNSTMVIPTQFVLFTISVIIGSAVLYRDFERENTEDGIKFVAGCALTFFGVWCITSGRKSDSEEEQSQPGDEEDAIDLVDEEGVHPEVRESYETRQSSFAASSSSVLQRHHSAMSESTARSLRAASMGPNLSASPPKHIDINTQPLVEQISHLPPADASAVHTTTVGPLSPELNKDTKLQPPVLHATTSEPHVPTTPNASRQRAPPERTSSQIAAGSPLRKTPSHPGQYLDPTGPPRMMKRQSMVGLMPGPLTSPLSGSLSAIVADELRRGIHRSPWGSLRRTKTPTLYQSAIDPDTDGVLGTGGLKKRHSIASIEYEVDDAENARRAAGSPPSGRMRSLSATLSDMFGSGSGSAKRQRALGAQEQRRQQSLEAAVDDRNEE